MLKDPIETAKQESDLKRSGYSLELWQKFILQFDDNQDEVEKIFNECYESAKKWSNYLNDYWLLYEVTHFCRNKVIRGTRHKQTLGIRKRERLKFLIKLSKETSIFDPTYNSFAEAYANKIIERKQK